MKPRRTIGNSFPLLVPSLHLLVPLLLASFLLASFTLAQQQKQISVAIPTKYVEQNPFYFPSNWTGGNFSAGTLYVFENIQCRNFIIESSASNSDILVHGSKTLIGRFNFTGSVLSNSKLTITGVTLGNLVIWKDDAGYFTFSGCTITITKNTFRWLHETDKSGLDAASGKVLETSWSLSYALYDLRTDFLTSPSSLTVEDNLFLADHRNLTRVRALIIFAERHHEKFAINATTGQEYTAIGGGYSVWHQLQSISFSRNIMNVSIPAEVRNPATEKEEDFYWSRRCFSMDNIWGGRTKRVKFNDNKAFVKNGTSGRVMEFYMEQCGGFGQESSATFDNNHIEVYEPPVPRPRPLLPPSFSAGMMTGIVITVQADYHNNPRWYDMTLFSVSNNNVTILGENWLAFSKGFLTYWGNGYHANIYNIDHMRFDNNWFRLSAMNNTSPLDIDWTVKVNNVAKLTVDHNYMECWRSSKGGRVDHDLDDKTYDAIETSFFSFANSSLFSVSHNTVIEGDSRPGREKQPLFDNPSSPVDIETAQREADKGTVSFNTRTFRSVVMSLLNYGADYYGNNASLTSRPYWDKIGIRNTELIQCDHNTHLTLPGYYVKKENAPYGLHLRWVFDIGRISLCNNFADAKIFPILLVKSLFGGGLHVASLKFEIIGYRIKKIECSNNTALSSVSLPLELQGKEMADSSTVMVGVFWALSREQSQHLTILRPACVDTHVPGTRPTVPGGCYEDEMRDVREVIFKNNTFLLHGASGGAFTAKTTCFSFLHIERMKNFSNMIIEDNFCNMSGMDACSKFGGCSGLSYSVGSNYSELVNLTFRNNHFFLASSFVPKKSRFSAISITSAIANPQDFVAVLQGRFPLITDLAAISATHFAFWIDTVLIQNNTVKSASATYHNVFLVDLQQFGNCTIRKELIIDRNSVFKIPSSSSGSSSSSSSIPEYGFGPQSTLLFFDSPVSDFVLNPKQMNLSGMPVPPKMAEFDQNFDAISYSLWSAIHIKKVVISNNFMKSVGSKVSSVISLVNAPGTIHSRWNGTFTVAFGSTDEELGAFPGSANKKKEVDASINEYKQFVKNNPTAAFRRGNTIFFDNNPSSSSSSSSSSSAAADFVTTLQDATRDVDSPSFPSCEEIFYSSQFSNKLNVSRGLFTFNNTFECSELVAAQEEEKDFQDRSLPGRPAVFFSLVNANWTFFSPGSALCFGNDTIRISTSTQRGFNFFETTPTSAYLADKNSKPKEVAGALRKVTFAMFPRLFLFEDFSLEIICASEATISTSTTSQYDKNRNPPCKFSDSDFPQLHATTTTRVNQYQALFVGSSSSSSQPSSQIVRAKNFQLKMERRSLPSEFSSLNLIALSFPWLIRVPSSTSSSSFSANVVPPALRFENCSLEIVLPELTELQQQDELSTFQPKKELFLFRIPVFANFSLISSKLNLTGGAALASLSETLKTKLENDNVDFPESRTQSIIDFISSPSAASSYSSSSSSSSFTQAQLEDQLYFGTPPPRRINFTEIEITSSPKGQADFRLIGGLISVGDYFSRPSRAEIVKQQEIEQKWQQENPNQPLPPSIRKEESAQLVQNKKWSSVVDGLVHCFVHNAYGVRKTSSIFQSMQFVSSLTEGSNFYDPCPPSPSASLSETISVVPQCAPFKLLFQGSGIDAASAVRYKRFLLKFILVLEQDLDTPAPLARGRYVPRFMAPQEGMPQREAFTNLRVGYRNVTGDSGQYSFNDPFYNDDAYYSSSSSSKQQQQHQGTTRNLPVQLRSKDHGLAKVLYGSIRSDRVLWVAVEFNTGMNRDQDHEVVLQIDPRLFACRRFNNYSDINLDEDSSYPVDQWYETSFTVGRRLGFIPLALIQSSVIGGNIAAVAAAGMSGPLVASSISRVGAMASLSECAYSMEAELTFIESPFAMFFGAKHGQYQRGAIVGNFFLLLLVTALLALTAFVRMYASNKKVRKWNKKHAHGSFRGKHDKKLHHRPVAISFKEACYLSKIPSALVIPVAILTHGSCSSGVALLLKPFSASDVVLSLVALAGHFCFYGWMVHVIFIQCPKQEWLEYREINKKRKRVNTRRFFRDSDEDIDDMLSEGMDATTRQMFEDCIHCNAQFKKIEEQALKERQLKKAKKEALLQVKQKQEERAKAGILSPQSQASLTPRTLKLKPLHLQSGNNNNNNNNNNDDDENDENENNNNNNQDERKKNQQQKAPHQSSVRFVSTSATNNFSFGLSSVNSDDDDDDDLERQALTRGLLRRRSLYQIFKKEFLSFIKPYGTWIWRKPKHVEQQEKKDKKDEIRRRKSSNNLFSSVFGSLLGNNNSEGGDGKVSREPSRLSGGSGAAGREQSGVSNTNNNSSPEGGLLRRQSQAFASGSSSPPHNLASLLEKRKKEKEASDERKAEQARQHSSSFLARSGDCFTPVRGHIRWYFFFECMLILVIALITGWQVVLEDCEGATFAVTLINVLPFILLVTYWPYADLMSNFFSTLTTILMLSMGISTNLGSVMDLKAVSVFNQFVMLGIGFIGQFRAIFDLSILAMSMRAWLLIPALFAWHILFHDDGPLELVMNKIHEQYEDWSERRKAEGSRNSEIDQNLLDPLDDRSQSSSGVEMMMMNQQRKKQQEEFDQQQKNKKHTRKQAQEETSRSSVYGRSMNSCWDVLGNVQTQGLPASSSSSSPTAAASGGIPTTPRTPKTAATSSSTTTPRNQLHHQNRPPQQQQRKHQRLPIPSRDL